MPPEAAAESSFEAELPLGQASARILRISERDEPASHVFQRDDHYWLDMCLTPRPEKARGCYPERWGSHRFERLGEIFLVPPGEALHVMTERGENQVSIVIEIEAKAVDRWLDHDLEWTDRRLEAGLDIVHPHIRSCLMRLAGETREGGIGSPMLGELIAGQLAIEVARYCEAIGEGPTVGGLASWRLRRIDERLHQPGEPPALRELAAICNMSIRQLTRGFRSSRGCSLGDHIAQTRIEMAKRYLASDDSIKSIAFALGFASPSSFSYAFGRATGLTPSRFRSRQQRRRG
jgi:AraC family transcriptional regulator